jgi:Reverse transcriptase (RNA-dependent DNA polymerase)
VVGCSRSSSSFKCGLKYSFQLNSTWSSVTHRFWPDTWPPVLRKVFPPVNQGVPQGSILGPLLFSLFVNDISNSILFSNYLIYVDDVQIYLSGSEENIASVFSQINTDLASIFEWSTQNGLCLNSKKTQAMAIYRHKP